MRTQSAGPGLTFPRSAGSLTHYSVSVSQPDRAPAGKGKTNERSPSYSEVPTDRLRPFVWFWETLLRTEWIVILQPSHQVTTDDQGVHTDMRDEGGVEGSLEGQRLRNTKLFQRPPTVMQFCASKLWLDLGGSPRPAS